MTNSAAQDDSENEPAAAVGVSESKENTTPQTLIAVATYNEIQNLPSLIDELSQVAPQADLLVIDDNSPDGTGKWCEQREATDSRFHCIHRSGKLGLGTATIEAMQYAVEQDYTFLVTLDADWSHPPAVIPTLLNTMQSETDQPTDVAIGSRYVPGGKVVGWPWRRRLMSRAVNTYARLLLRLPVRDMSGAFRCYRVSCLSRLDWSAVRSRGYSFFEEILWHLRCAGARFEEVPITFTDRQHGESKINFREALTALKMIARLGVSAWFGKR